MLHDDYLMRLLRPFIAALAEIIFLKKERDAGRALEAIDTASVRLLGLNASLLTLLSERYLTDLLEVETDYGALRCAILAALLKQEGDVYALLENENAAVTRWQKALRIYMQVLPTHNIPDEASHLPEIIDMANRLRGFEVDPELRHTLMGFFEGRRQYAQAENVLYDLIEGSPDPLPEIERGIAFYERLLPLHPGRLISGGLPPAEIAAGLAELRSAHTRFSPPQTN